MTPPVNTRSTKKIVIQYKLDAFRPPEPLQKLADGTVVVIAWMVDDNGFAMRQPFYGAFMPPRPVDAHRPAPIVHDQSDIFGHVQRVEDAVDVNLMFGDVV